MDEKTFRTLLWLFRESILFEFENKQIQKKIAHLKQLAKELGYDVLPQEEGQKEIIALDLNIQTDGQLAFC